MVDLDAKLPAELAARAGDTLTLTWSSPLVRIAELDADGTPLPWGAALTAPPTAYQPAGLYTYVRNADGDVPRPDSWGWPESSGPLVEFEPSRLCPTMGHPCNFAEVDALLDAAWAAGKVASIGLRWGRQGTPDWYPSAGARLLTFNDQADADSGSCDMRGSICNPADLVCLELVIDTWRQLGAHLRQRGDRYGVVAGVEGIGIAWQTIEVRLPDTDACGSNAIWQQAGYTPQHFYDFALAVLEVMTTEFPGRSVRYSLIQAGFPGDGTVETTTLTGKGTTAGLAETALGPAWLVKHNGARPGQMPNRWVMDAGTRGQRAGYQTINEKNGVATGAELIATLEQVLAPDLEAVFVEGYETPFAEAREIGLMPYVSALRARDTWTTSHSVVLEKGDRWFVVSGQDTVVHVTVR